MPSFIMGTLLLTLFVRLLHVETAQGSTIVKIVVDGVLFVASFFIQKFWVFSKNDKKEES